MGLTFTGLPPQMRWPNLAVMSLFLSLALSPSISSFRLAPSFHHHPNILKQLVMG